jgi:CARDB
MILRFEPLEGRQLLATAPRFLPDLVPQSIDTLHNLDWGDSFHAVGTVLNQGGGATTAPFKVDIFASPSPYIGPTSVLLGSVEIPAGLARGASAYFDQVLSLPSTPLPGTDQTQAVLIDVRVNHDRTVVERNYRNDQRNGQGLDMSLVNITPRQPASLIGTAIGLTPNSLTWGETFTLTSQVTNTGAGDAPPTRARVVLTPQGLLPGGPADMTVDSLIVPAMGAFQSANVVHNVKLPDIPPSSLASSTQFTLTLIPDADFQTNQGIANQVVQGLGFDQAVITVLPGPLSNEPPAPLPDVAPAAVQVESGTAYWGQTILVSTDVQNLGPGDVGPVRVRFLLAGANGTLASSIFLADANMPALKAGATQAVTQTVKIPGRLPNGMIVNGTGLGRIMVWVDPESEVDETLKTNNMASSAPIQLRLLGTDGTTTVPTQPGTGKKAAQPVKKDTGLKRLGKQISHFFKDIGDKLSITGHSR